MSVFNISWLVLLLMQLKWHNLPIYLNFYIFMFLRVLYDRLEETSGTRITTCSPINIHELCGLYHKAKIANQSDIVKSDIVTKIKNLLFQIVFTL